MGTRGFIYGIYESELNVMHVCFIDDFKKVLKLMNRTNEICFLRKLPDYTSIYCSIICKLCLLYEIYSIINGVNSFKINDKQKTLDLMNSIIDTHLESLTRDKPIRDRQPASQDTASPVDTSSAYDNNIACMFD